MSNKSEVNSQDNVDHSEEKDLSALADVSKWKEASKEDQDAFIAGVEDGSISLEQDEQSETSTSEETSSEEDDSKDKEHSNEDQNSEDASSSSDNDDDDNDDEDDNSTSQSDSTDKEEKDNKNKEDKKDFDSLQKSYKSLEAEFTRRSQKLKELENKVEELSNKSTKDDNKKKSVIDQIRAKDVNTANVLEALKEEIKEEARREVMEEVGALKSAVDMSKAESNKEIFSQEIDKFLTSPLKSLEPQLLEVINENFSTQEELHEAAGKNPNLFKDLKKEFLARNYKKVAQLEEKISRSKKTSNSSEERDRQIQDGKGTGKSKSSSKEDAASDPSDIEVFKKLSKEKQETFLKKHKIWN